MRKRRTEQKSPDLQASGEFLLIQEIKRHYIGFQGKARNIGIGDDCAVIKSLPDRDLLVTTDSQMEMVHFHQEERRPELIGERAVAITLSDIAAMGGQPDYLFLNLGLPSALSFRRALGIMSGIHKACQRYRVSLLGGDTFQSHGGILLCLMAIGSLPKGKAVLRSGAHVGDGLYLTGLVGGSALGLILLRKGYSLIQRDSFQRKVPKKYRKHIKMAIESHMKPSPHLQEGAFLAGKGLAHSMIDLSDGLSADLHHLCQASRVGARIYEESLPVHPSLPALVRDRQKALKIALSGGEDYCLLFTISRQKERQAMNAFQKKFSRPLYRIGHIVPESEGFHLVSEQGRVKTLSKMGYEHFKGSSLKVILHLES